MNAKTVHFEPKIINDVLDIIHNAIIVINSNNKIIFANSRTVEMFRTSDDALHNMEFSTLFMPDDAEIMVANILHLTRKNHEFEGEAMLRRPDGSSFMGMISGSSFLWDNNQEGMAFSIHDLTAMKAIEDSLKYSERIAFLGRLVDDISHQIRNPLMVIGGFTRRLNTEGEAASKNVKTIINEVTRLESLLDTLNNFTNLRRPKTTRIPIADLVDMAETTLRDIVETRGCTWVSHYRKDIIDEDLLIDKELIEEALGEIINNACESYTGNEEEKKVVFQIHRSPNHSLPYVINIIDYGVGISSENSPHVLGHFYSTKTRHIGMGLTLAQRIVEEQRGTLTIRSEAGKGSTVCFHLVKERRRPLRTVKL